VRPNLKVETMPIASNNNPSSIEVSLFNQIAMFSASGLVMSMAFIVVGGLRILHPWF
jgi:hypothetical protein